MKTKTKTKEECVLRSIAVIVLLTMTMLTVTSCQNILPNFETPDTSKTAVTTKAPSVTKAPSSEEKTTPPETEDPLAAELINAKLAYQYLINAHQMSVQVMDSIYDAWHFAIYLAGDYTSFQSCFDNFCEKTNLNKAIAEIALEKAMELYGYTGTSNSTKLEAMNSFDVTLTIVELVFSSDGTYDALDSLIDGAKTSLKAVTNKYESQTGYSELKKYYAKTKAYIEICEGVTGSFEQLKQTIQEFESELTEYKYDLDLILN